MRKLWMSTYSDRFRSGYIYRLNQRLWQIHNSWFYSVPVLGVTLWLLLTKTDTRKNFISLTQTHKAEGFCGQIIITFLNERSQLEMYQCNVSLLGLKTVMLKLLLLHRVPVSPFTSPLNLKQDWIKPFNWFNIHINNWKKLHATQKSSTYH